MTKIEFKDMSFGYDAKIILDRINLVFDKPELVCVLGPNGVGKTTLVKCINKLLVPVSGTVELDGQDVHKMSYFEMAQHLAYVPNTSGNVFSMSVAETILMGRHPKAGWTTSEADMDAVVNAIEVLGLEEFASRDVRALSAGQVQRVMIARGLVQEPEVLILDEPTSNLDVKYQMGVMKFLKAYARDKGIIVIIVCHDLNITAAYADRVVLVYDRRVYADGSAKEVLTAENIEEVYKVKAKVNEVDGVPHIFLVPEYDRGDTMEKNQMIMIVVAIAAIVIVAAAAVVLTGGGGGGGGGHDEGDRVGDTIKEKDWPSTDSRLWVYGNANEDDYLDSKDITYIEGIINGKNKETQLADANVDGVVDSKDIDKVKEIIYANANSKLNVYYLDNYFKVAKVGWPVKTFATGFSSGYYASEVAGVVGKIKMVDQMLYDGWAKLNHNLDNVACFGWTEEPDWEALLASGIDVYVPGYFDSKADQIMADKLKGIDIMFMNTSDNEFVDVPNEHIDRSTTTFGFLIQGNMDQVYEWLAWHDNILGKLMDAAATLKESDKAYMIQARTDPTRADDSGKYMFAGKNQTNNIHAEWAGVYAVGNHDALMSHSNYPTITMEQVMTVIDRNGDSDGRVYFVDNENSGVVNYRTLRTTLTAWENAITSTNEVYYLGQTREMGNSPLYLIEMIFYQNVMYPQLTKQTGLEYWEQLEYFVDHFAEDKDRYQLYVLSDYEQWFIVDGPVD